MEEAKDKRVDNGTRDRIDEIKHLVNKGTRRTSVILGVMFVLQIGIGIWTILINQDQSDQQTAIVLQQRRENSQQRQIAHIVADNERSRQDAVRTSCEDQNKRHDDTIDALNKIIDKAIKANPAARKGLEGSRAQNIFLVGRLAPSRNCDNVVKRLGTTVPTPTTTPTPAP